MLAGLFLLAIPAASQLQYGELSTHLSGTIAPGYTADWGNQTSSDHSWTIGGEADLVGSYHNPNFLTFNASFYLNQSRANSDFQSISNSSGFNLSTTLFGGTHFPLSINYSKAYNSDGNYDVPGVANYVTHGNSSTLGINWSESIPDAPSFSIGYQRGNSQYTVYGTNDNGNNNFQSLNLHSGYHWQGFNMGAYYTLGDSHSLIPQVITGEASTQTKSDGSALGFNISHQLPMHGTFGAAYSRSSWNSTYLGDTNTGAINTFDASVSFHPINKLAFSTSLSYSDNLSGQLYESIISGGGVIPGLDTSQSSNSLDLEGVITYSLLQDLHVQGNVERRTQSFLGEDYGVTSYGLGLTYSRNIFKGSFNSSFSATENTSDQSRNTTLGLTTSESYATEIRGWQVNGSFNYSQNVETLLITYMNSFYNYSASMRRRWGRFHVGAGASAGHTGLTQQPGSDSSSQSFNLNTGFGAMLTASGTYSRSSGQAITTGAGLVPVPIPPIVPPSMLSLYGGNSYSFSLASSPIKRFTLSAAYSNSNSNTSSDSIASQNKSNQFNALLQYQVRKLSFTSGYSRLEQGFSVTGTEPQVISSFYVGASRWFKFF
jgi:hypothetical protein